MNKLTPIQKFREFEIFVPLDCKDWQYNLIWAIYCLNYSKIYPSARRINVKLARFHRYDLNGRECKLRKEIFRKLNIKKHINQYG